VEGRGACAALPVAGVPAPTTLAADVHAALGGAGEAGNAFAAGGFAGARAASVPRSPCPFPAVSRAQSGACGSGRRLVLPEAEATLECGVARAADR
jgi:hypothetical protein